MKTSKKTTTTTSLKRVSSKRITPRSKGYGFWQVQKRIEGGIKIYHIVSIDDQKRKIEHFGRLDFARNLARLHNEEILALFRRAQIEQGKISARAAATMALAKSVPELLAIKIPKGRSSLTLNMVSAGGGGGGGGSNSGSGIAGPMLAEPALPYDLTPQEASTMIIGLLRQIERNTQIRCK